jgi:hypothetical protein
MLSTHKGMDIEDPNIKFFAHQANTIYKYKNLKIKLLPIYFIRNIIQKLCQTVFLSTYIYYLHVQFQSVICTHKLIAFSINNEVLCAFENEI